MSNRQLAVLVGAIFLAVLLAYQLFVGFDLRSSEQKHADEREAQLDEQQNQLDEQYRKLDAELGNAGF